MHKLVTSITAALLLAAGVGTTARANVSPASLVDPFVGTSGTKIGGPIDTFPGADVPFGMVQWSPDTPSQNAGGGYEYGDHAITGLSLTHLSGPGCSVFGDFAVLPTVGTVIDPADAKQTFSHADESAAPGSYAVEVGAPTIHAELTVTPRTGFGRFTFPPAAQASTGTGLVRPALGTQRRLSAHRLRRQHPHHLGRAGTQRRLHSGSRSAKGPAWVAAVVNAVGKSQYWNSTAVFILWDDWGGWYDHVAPPIYNHYELGFRVPLVVVSPYAKKGYVSHVTHEFGSILKFAEETYNLGSLNTTDTRSDDLMDSFDFSQKPRTFTPIKAPPFHGGSDTLIGSPNTEDP